VLIPSWSTECKVKNAARTINARADAITTSRLWRGIVPRHRCLVVANGYFEWLNLRGKKVPYFIRHKDEGTLITFAGLYDVWVDPNTGEKTFTYSVVTTDANKKLAFIHERMPVVLETEEEQQLWLNANGSTVSDEVLGLLKPYAGTNLVFYQVEGFVNSVKNNSERCVQPASQQKGRIDNFFKKPKEEFFTIKRKDADIDWDKEGKAEAVEEDDSEKGKEKEIKPEREDDDAEQEDEEEEEDVEAEVAPAEDQAEVKPEKRKAKKKRSKKAADEDDLSSEDEDVEMKSEAVAGKKRKRDDKSKEAKEEQEKEKEKPTSKRSSKKKKD